MSGAYCLSGAIWVGCLIEGYNKFGVVGVVGVIVFGAIVSAVLYRKFTKENGA